MTRVLWTGGWDSSFRLMQALLVEGRTVEPIHVLQEDRPRTPYELRAMHRMRAGLVERLDDPARLLATTVVLASEFPTRQHLYDLRKRILQRGWIGTQYVTLASIAEALDWQDVELSVERYEDGDPAWEQVVFSEPGVLNGSPEAELFRRFTFPVIHLTKREMAQVAREHGFADLLRLRWFCHEPVLGRPCGRCRPCRLANAEDVHFANPVASLAAHGVRTAGRAGRRVRRTLHSPAGAQRPDLRPAPAAAAGG